MKKVGIEIKLIKEISNDIKLIEITFVIKPQSLQQNTSQPLKYISLNKTKRYLL